MKWVKWILILIVTLIGLSIGSLYFLFNPALQRLKPEIVNTLAKSFGTEVVVGEISAQLLPSLKVELSNVSVGGVNGANLKKLYIDSSISELLSGKLAISNISIDSPSAEIVKLEDGSFRIGKFVFGQQSQAAQQNNSGSNAIGTESKEKSIDIKITKFSIRNGTLVYVDNSKDQKVSISNFSLELNNFSPESSSPIKFAFSLFGNNSANIEGAGTLVTNSFKTKTPVADLVIRLSSLDIDSAIKLGVKNSPGLKADGTLSGEIKIVGTDSGVKAALDLDATSASIMFRKKDGAVLLSKEKDSSLKLTTVALLSPSKILNLSPLRLKFQDSTISGNLVLDLNTNPIPEIEGAIECTGLNLEPFNVKQIGGKLIFKKNLISTESLNLKFQGEEVKLSGDLLRYTANSLDTPNLKISTLGGSLLVQNTLINEGDKSFSGSITGGAIDLRRLLSLYTNLPPYSVAGTLSKFSSTFKGTMANLNQDLQTTFSILISNGEIIGINLIGGVFQKAGKVPGLGDSLLQLVPEKYKPLVTAANSTSFDSLTVDGNLTSGTEINLSKVELVHSAYLILGSGKASTKGRLDLKTQMKITKAVTEGMVAKNGNLKLLLDKEDNLTFPLLISKDDGPVIVLPDISELGKNALKSTTKDAALKALDKVSPDLRKGASQFINKLF